MSQRGASNDEFLCFDCENWINTNSSNDSDEKRYSVVCGALGQKETHMIKPKSGFRVATIIRCSKYRIKK
jgi:hypothetical protein